MKILVAIDESPYSEYAIEQLGAGVWWGDTEFSIVHVVNVPTVRQWEAWGLDVDWNLREKLLVEGQKLVDDQVGLLKKLVTKGLKVEGKVLERSADVADVIVAEAVNSHVDLIVIGSRCRTGIGNFIFGSVARDVLVKAPCSVEVIKSENAFDEGKIRKESRSSAHSTTVRSR